VGRVGGNWPKIFLGCPGNGKWFCNSLVADFNLNQSFKSKSKIFLNSNKGLILLEKQKFGTFETKGF
jgi:hypothetical protein